MLDEKAAKDFKTLVTEFVTNVRLSKVATARILRVTYPSLDRWTNPAYTGTVYDHTAAQVSSIINRLNRVNERVGLYGNLVDLSAQNREIELEVALQNNPS